MTFTSIRNASDVARFAGKMVAYLTTPENYYFVGKAYKISGVAFGRIVGIPSPWDSGEQGYNMDRILVRDGVAGNTALVNSLMKDHCKEFLMRECSQEELSEIALAIRSKHAIMEYTQDSEALKYIES